MASQRFDIVFLRKSHGGAAADGDPILCEKKMLTGRPVLVRLAELKRQRADVQHTFKDTAPAIEALNESIVTLEAQLKNEDRVLQRSEWRTPNELNAIVTRSQLGKSVRLRELDAPPVAGIVGLAVVHLCAMLGQRICSTLSLERIQRGGMVLGLSFLTERLAALLQAWGFAMRLSQAHLIALVAEARASTMPVVENALCVLRTAFRKVDGVIVNRWRFEVPPHVLRWLPR